MATLTQEWSTYASKTWSSGSNKSVTFQLQARYISQSISGNSSVIQTRLRSVRNSSSFGGYPYKFTCSYASTVSGSNMWTVQTEVITTSPNKTITHNSNGTKTLTLSASASITGLGLSVSLSCTVAIPTIPRQATINSAPNFNDEQNPTITYSNPAGNNVTTLKAGIFSTNGYTAYASYRNISKTGTSYTFTLTDAERNTLRSAAANSGTLSVRFYVQTVIGGNTYTSYLTRTLTIVNANPTFEATYQDTNASTIAITGDNQLLIQNQSTLQIDVTDATAYKYASLSSIQASINGIIYNGTISGSTATFNIGTIDVSQDIDAIITLTDSRGYKTNKSLALQVLEWQLPTANITLQRQNNYYSATDITVDANYSSLDNQNTIDIKVRTKKTTDGSYGAYTTLTDNVTSTLTLDNQYEWDVQVVITDRLGSTTYNLTLDKGMPIIYFDRLKRSVAINCFPNDNESLELMVNNNQINVGELLYNRDFICCVLTSQQNITATGEGIVKLNSVLNQRGNGFTFANNVVTCHFDGYVEVSGQIQFANAGNTNTHNIYIYHNNSVVGRSLSAAYTNGVNKVGWVTPIIIQVSNGDIIKLNYYAINGENLNAVANSTNMTLKRL